MKQFEVGKRYFHNFVTQSDTTVEYEVVGRSEKMIHVKNIYTKEIIKKKVTTFGGSEMIYPLGKYSMCPTLKATNEL